MGHPGHWKTYELVFREYWWPGLSQFTKNFVEGCAVCQSTKNKPKTRIPLQPNQIPTGVWKSITMDFIILTPCRKTITAEQTSQLYMDHVWRHTGLPQQVISNRGPQFASKVMRETWKKLNVQQSLSTAFHPQTDKETERVNQEVEQFLRVFCNYQQDN